MCRTGQPSGKKGRAQPPAKGPAASSCPAHLPPTAPSPSPPYPTAHRVDAFVEQCRQLANVTRGPDIMFTMGSDFQFQNAHLQYKNLDKLIHYVNLDGRVNAFYSTPAE